MAQHSYTAHQPLGGRTYARNRAQHGARLSDGLVASFKAAEERRPPAEALPPGIEVGDGAFVTIELSPSARELDIEKPDRGLRQSAAGEDQNRRTMVLHLEDQSARDFLVERVDRYRSAPLTDAGNPPLASEMEPIEDFLPTQLLDVWREDPAAIPSEDSAQVWWGLWCWEDFTDDVTNVAAALGMQVAPQDRWSTFPDILIVPVYATRTQVQAMLDIGRPGLAEPGLFIQFFSGRLRAPESTVESIC